MSCELYKEKKKHNENLTESLYHSRGTKYSFMEDMKFKIMIENRQTQTEKVKKSYMFLGENGLNKNQAGRKFQM